MKIKCLHSLLLSTLCLAVPLFAQWQYPPLATPHKSEDGSWLLDRQDTSLRVFDADTLELRFVIPGDLWPQMFSNDGETLFYKSIDEGLFSINLKNGERRQLAALPHLQQIILSEDEASLIVVAASPDVYKPASLDFYRIDLSQEAATPTKFASVLPQSLPWAKPISILPARDAQSTLVLFREGGPTGDKHEPRTYTDFVFAEVSLRDGSITQRSVFDASHEKALWTGPRWVDASRKLLEHASGDYHLIDPYAGEIVREFSLPGVSFILNDDVPGQIIARRVVDEGGEKQYLGDYLESGTLKTIRNEVAADKKTLYRGHAPSLPEFPADPTPIRYASYAFHPSKPEFFATTSDETVHFYRASVSGLQFQNRGAGAYWAQYSPDGSEVFHETLFDSPTSQTVADRFPSHTGITYEDPQLRNADPVHASPPIISPSGQWLVKTNNRATTLHQLGKAAIVTEIDRHWGAYNSPLSDYRFASDESALFRISYQSEWDPNGNRVYLPHLEALAFAAAQTSSSSIWSVKLDSTSIVWIDDVVGSSIHLIDTESGQLHQFSTASGAQTTSAISGFTPQAFVGQSGGYVRFEDRVYMARGSKVISLTLSKDGLRVDAVLPLASSVAKLHRYGDQRHLVAQLGSGSLVFLDTAPAELSVALTLDIYSGQQGDFLAYTPGGTFDAGAEVIRSGYLISGVQPIKLASIEQRSFQPGLMLAALGADAVAEDRELPEYVQPPVVQARETWTAALSRRINFTAGSNQYPLQEVALYQNGKLVQTLAAEGASLRGGFEVELLLEKNELEVVVINTAGVSARSQQLVVEPPQALLDEAIANRRPPELHLVAIGVNVYRNPEYNLNYAEADASSVLEKIKAANSELFATIHTHHLKSEQATGQAIRDALDQVRARALPHDAFIFYFAGHGVMSQLEDQFYLVPHDVTRIYGESQSLTENGLSADRLRDISATIKAQKQLFILDACNSGGALKAFTRRGASREKAVAQLARATGTHWITASSESQFATEFSDLGHGAFTYAMLKALDGAADTGDQRVTVNELKAYLESQLPVITKEHRGLPQYPASYGSGQDFPIALTL